MGNMTITDGRTGSPHITAAEVWAANVGIWGAGDRLLSSGQNMRAQIISNNTVRVYDGVASLQGLRCGIPYGQYIDVGVENGATGQKRRDAIYIEYVYNPTLRTMDTSLKIKKGVSGTSYVSPSLITGDIAAGALLHQALLQYVDINGLSIAAVTGQMAPPAVDATVASTAYPVSDTALKTLYGSTATLKSILRALGASYKVGTGITGNWRWDKWSDGRAMAMRSEAIAFSNFELVNGMYRSQQSVNLPFLFKTLDSAGADGQNTGVFAGVNVTELTNVSTIYITAQRGTGTGAVTLNVLIRVEGTWK